MKNNKKITLIYNVLIYIYSTIVCYSNIKGLNESTTLLFSGISIGLLMSINIAYIQEKLRVIEIILMFINFVFIALTTYLSFVFIQLDVR